MLDQAVQELLAAIVQAAAVLLSMGAVWGLRYAIALLKAKLGETQFNQVAGYADKVVRALEQSGYLNIDGAEKKARAIVAIRTFAKQHNIELDDKYIDEMIESAVQVMNAAVTPIIQGELLDTFSPEKAG